MKKGIIYMTVFLLTVLLGSAIALALDLNATYSGWYTSAGANNSSNMNYLVGNGSGGNYYNNFFVFDLSGVSQNITSATLSIQNPSFYLAYFSNDPSETWTLYDVSTPVATLIANASGRTDIFNDLGGGTVFGSVTVTSASNGAIVNVPLNAAAIAALNAAKGGSFAIGGAITTLDSNSSTDEYLFGGSSNSNSRQLTLTFGPSVTVGYNPTWLIITLVILTLVGGYLLQRRMTRQ